MRFAPSGADEEEIQFIDFRVFFDCLSVSEKIATVDAKKKKEADIGIDEAFFELLLRVRAVLVVVLSFCVPRPKGCSLGVT